MPLPSRRQALWFWVRIRLLTARRIVQDALDPQVRIWPRVPTSVSRLRDAPVLAEVRSPLWADGRPDEFALVAGKVHNLRLARRAFDGLELPAAGLLSFWQQLGRATRRRGYVAGREVREGCVVPTLAGGLCQLSNALASVAHRAGMALPERHAHTARPEGVAPGAHGAVDATVLWKHIDLRVRADMPWRLEVAMDADELVVRVRAFAAPPPAGRRTIAIDAAPCTDRPHAAAPPVARGCLSCDQTACFRHAPQRAGSADALAARAILLEGVAPELAQAAAADPRLAPGRWVLPHAVTPGQRAQVARRRAPEGWDVMPPGAAARLLAWRRAWHLRRHARSPGRRQASILQGQAWQARQAARALRPADVELLVDQAYLPTLWIDGALAGRRLDVWMPALPMREIARRLDAAARAWPDEPSLADFRPDPASEEAEWQALRGARRIFTPHHAVAQWARETLSAEVVELPWQCPPAAAAACGPAASPPLVVLLSSALPRKGSRELAAALRHLQQDGRVPRLGVLGSLPAQDDPHWAGLPCVPLGYRSDWRAQARVAVLPAHVEHSPRAALQALAAGLPVIATPACGLPPQPGLTLVPGGDVAALAQALRPHAG